MNQSLVPNNPTEVQNISNSLAKSGYFKDANDATKAFVKVLAGAELGIPAFQSMSGIHIVQGKPQLSAGIMAALIKRSGKYNYRIVGEHTTEACKIEFFEDGKSIGFSEMTMAEAKKANLHQEWDRDKNAWKDKATWKNFPKNMLFNRALSNGAKWHCPDIFGGPVYAEGEIEEVPVTIQDTTAEVVQERQPYERYAGYYAEQATQRTVAQQKVDAIAQPTQQTIEAKPVQQAAPVKLTKEQNAVLMRDVQNWNSKLGELEVAYEENRMPECWDAIAKALGEIPNLPMAEKKLMFFGDDEKHINGLVHSAKELGVHYDKATKKFSLVDPEATVETELDTQLDQTLAVNE